MSRKEKQIEARNRPPGVDELVERIFREDHEHLIRFAYYTLQDRQLAEVAVQEAYTLAFEKSEKFLASPNPTGWMFEAVRRIIKHLLRERQYLLLHNTSLDAGSENDRGEWDTYSVIPNIIADSDEMKLLWAFYIEGYTSQELADHYGIENGACKMRILRARQKLAEKLK